jgi:ribose transport system permease protein
MELSLKRISPTARQVGLAYGSAAALFIVGMIVSSSFTGERSTAALSTQAAFIGIAAMGQTFVMLSGGVDLSVPWVMTSSAIVMSELAQGSSEALWWVIPLTLLFGALIGTINGIGVAALGVSSIVMTLAMNEVLQGASLLLTDGSPSTSIPHALAHFPVAQIGPVRVILLLWLGLAVLATLLLGRTVFGRRLYALGTNERAARFSGIRTIPVRVAAYSLAGMASAAAGILVAGFNQTVFLGMGDPYLFSTIAAVAVGGIAMAGGQGSYVGTVAGALVLAILAAILPILNISAAALSIVYGAVILVTVSIGTKRVNPVDA